MGRVVICMPALVHGDAGSHFVLQISRVLGALGHRPEVLAPLVDPAMRCQGRAAKRLPADLAPNDRILLVHSTTSPWVLQLDPPPIRTLLLYQGLTPPELCGPFGLHLAGPLKRAREELAAVAPHLRGAICTSRTAASELAAITGDAVECEIVPLVLDQELYPPSPRSPGQLGGRRPRRLLVVGRAVPHKRLEIPVAIHALLQGVHSPDLALDIVGDTSTCPEYVSWLQRVERPPSLPPPRWWGRVSFPNLARRYQDADLLLFSSAHEGFGVPLLEAMTFGVPVVATHCDGVAETLGHAGLIVRGDHLAATAELAAMILEDSALRGHLIASGHERAKHFAPETLLERLRPAWERLAA